MRLFSGQPVALFARCPTISLRAVGRIAAHFLFRPGLLLRDLWLGFGPLVAQLLLPSLLLLFLPFPSTLLYEIDKSFCVAVARVLPKRRCKVAKRLFLKGAIKRNGGNRLRGSCYQKLGRQTRNRLLACCVSAAPEGESNCKEQNAVHRPSPNIAFSAFTRSANSPNSPTHEGSAWNVREITR